MFRERLVFCGETPFVSSGERENITERLLIVQLVPSQQLSKDASTGPHVDTERILCRP